MNESGRTVVIVGGGAAGLVAAIAAARAGAPVTLLERQDRVGRKLLATGNGRCNLANLDPDPAHWHGRQPGFPDAVLARFDVARTLAFFRELGLAPEAEESGRVYPRSRQASAVLDVLRWELDDLGVRVACGAEVVAVAPSDRGFELRLAGAPPLAASSVVLAAGGRAAPTLGGCGLGYDLARALGHRVVQPFPALAQVRLSSPWPKSLQGTKFDGAVEVRVDDRPAASARGEILFTDYGVSGNAVLDVSRVVGGAVRAGCRVSVHLAVLDDATRDGLAGRFAARPGRPVQAALVGLLHKKLIPAVLKVAGVTPATPAGDLDAADLDRIVATLRDWRFDAEDTAGWAGAQVTAGGIDTADVDPGTLESRLVPGLFLAGEVLDVDGDCGGFNLQWAWSSGYVAGEEAARRSEV